MRLAFRMMVMAVQMIVVMTVVMVMTMVVVMMRHAARYGRKPML